MTRRRFYLVYAAAWQPYALSYYLLFRLAGFSTNPLLEVLYNIAPAMAAGILVVRWCALVPWRKHGQPWFYPAQLGAAVVYALLWYAGVLFSGSLGHALETHHFIIGSFGGYALQWQFFSGLMIYGNIAGAVYVLQANESLRVEERRRERAEALQTSAELSALRAQLNPHFLFNTLNSIVALAGPGQPKTTHAIAQLASMLRYTLNQCTDEDGVSLREELEFTEQYLALEMLRLGERLTISRDVRPAALSCRLPPLTVQPLVENAIRHGISPLARGGTLSLRAVLRGTALHLEVEDDGAGADVKGLRTASGLGMRTVRQRLELFSHGQARVAVCSAPNAGYTVSITLPQDTHELAQPVPEHSRTSL